MTRFNVDDLMEAYRERDMDRMLAVFADDVEIIAEGTKFHMTDKDGLRTYAEDALSSVNDLDIEVIEQLASPDGKQVAVLLKGHVEYGADFDMLGEHFDAAGKKLDIDAALFLTANEEGKITRMHRVRDNWPIMRAFDISAEKYDAMLDTVKEELSAE